MKVLFISDFSLKHTIGGAQRSNDIVCKKGLDLGYEITMLHIDVPHEEILNKKYDIVISSNMEAFSTHKKEVLEYCCDVDNHYRLEHDMCRYLENDVREKLFGNCVKTFFLTEYHINKFVENYGNIFKNVVIVPDPIKKNIFYDYNKERSNEILYAGFMHPYKGTNNFLDFTVKNQDKNFVVVGWGDQKYIDFMNQRKNIRFFGSAHYETMPQIYNKFKYMYYNPVIDEPFCRSVGEAIMCGMEILGDSKKIGCVHSYKKHGRKKFIEDCNNADKIFWETIECQLL
jgi:glycosyltransferase involved in cell wall biosynthesis